MDQMEMVYSDDTLFINMSGIYNSKNISKLKRKMYHVINQYGINNVVIDRKNISKIDDGAFYDMLDDYDIKYGGNLKVEE